MHLIQLAMAFLVLAVSSPAVGLAEEPPPSRQATLTQYFSFSMKTGASGLGHDAVTYTLVNEGEEALAIQWTSLQVDGQPVSTWQEMATIAGASPQDLQLWTRLDPGDVIGPYRELDLFLLRSSDKNFPRQRLRFRSCFCTLDGAQCWTLGLPGAADSPAPVESCESVRPDEVLYDV